MLVDAIFALSLHPASTEMALSHCLTKACPVETGEWGSHSLTKAGGHMQSTQEMPLIAWPWWPRGLVLLVSTGL